MRRLALTAVALISLWANVGFTAEKKVILPKGAGRNAGWSHGILIDGTLYVSGMGGEDGALFARRSSSPSSSEAGMWRSPSPRESSSFQRVIAS